MKKLVIISTNFGTNFSGGCTATHEVFSRIQEHFSEIIVVCKQVGNHKIEKLKWLSYQNWIDAYLTLKSLSNEECVFYGDFYNAYLLKLAGKPYYFTYHDNWPELGDLSFGNQLSKVFYWFFYKRIFLTAQKTITVSDFKKYIILKYTDNVEIIRNGIPQSEFIPNNGGSSREVLMVGNIDKRKYSSAVKLFRLIKAVQIDVQISIYGNVTDTKIASELSTFSFVTMKGFSNKIPFHEYSCLLHTSLMENLSLVWCEAAYHGLPVITFDVGGAKEIVNSENGVLIDPYDIRMMLDALIKVVKGEVLFNPDLEKISGEFNWEAASKSYLKLFNETITVQN